MKTYLRNGMSVLALLASVGIAAAAGADATHRRSGLNLTTAQEHDIFQSVGKLNVKETAPDGFKASVGEKVPDAIQLHALPSSVTTQVPAVRRYEYAMLQNEVLVVNPKTKRVADIITQ